MKLKKTLVSILASAAVMIGAERNARADLSWDNFAISKPSITAIGYSPNPVDNEGFSWISPDGNYMLVSDYRTDPLITHVSSRTKVNGIWEYPIVLIPTLSVWGCLSPDKETIYYLSGSDTFASKKISGSWTPGVSVPNVQTTTGSEVFTMFNGHALYFNEELLENPGRYKVWKSDYNRSTDTFSTSVPIESINEYSSEYPWVSLDNQFMLFSSNRPGGYGDYDLYSARWDGSQWGDITNLGPNVNSPANERFPRIAEDAGVLFFVRNQELRQTEVIPEPSTISLLGLSSLGFLYKKRK